MQLIYFSPVYWATFAQRPHKFIEWFHAKSGGRVVWVDRYPTRFPSLTDYRRLGTPGTSTAPQIPSWLTVLRPPALPIEPLPVSGWVNGFLWNGVVKSIEDFARKGPTILAIGKPSVLALAMLKGLEGIPSVYDAMDDFPAFYKGLSRLAMASREMLLVRQVKHVLVSSTALAKRWSNVRSDVQLVRNALDSSVLPNIRSRVSEQHEAKVFGYVGTIGLWFDWDWVIALARARPLDTVRLIGSVFTPAPSMLPPNVEVLPARAHATALQAMLDFDVGLIPFKKSDLTASVDPIKYYEYRALGLPVISTAFGEMAFRGSEKGTFLSMGKQDIGKLVKDALLYRPDAEAIRQFTASNTWEARFAATKLL